MPEEMLRFACQACRKTIKAKPKFAGQKIACPACHHPLRVPGAPSVPKKARDSTVILRNSPPPTESQKREARKLGLAFPEKITQRELVERIEWHKKNRLARIQAAVNPFEAVLGELTPEEFMDEMLVRRMTGVLILLDADDYAAERDGLGEAKLKFVLAEDLSAEDLPELLRRCLGKLAGEKDAPAAGQR